MYHDRQTFNRDVIMAWETCDLPRIRLLNWIRRTFFA